MTKKYIVKKDFLDDQFTWWKPGEEFSREPSMFIDALLATNFIEEVKEPRRWRAPKGDLYWPIGINPEWHDGNDPIHVRVYEVREEGGDWDRDCYEGKNYFRSEETGDKVKEVIEQFLEFLHTPYSDDYSVSPLHSAMNEARAAVLADNERQS